MEIINSLRDITNNLDESKLFLTIGNFDGVHKGHADFLSSIRDEATNAGAKVVAFTFVPHPQFVLAPQTNFLISSNNEKRKLLSNLGVDYLCEIDFSRDFSTISGRDFFNDYLLLSDNVSSIYFGHDFAFGANKKGSNEVAQTLCKENGINLHILDKFNVNENRVSSSLIREQIKTGDIAEVKKYLGREYSLSGTVVKGKGRGRQLGFSTANLKYDTNLVIPQNGVYSTKTTFKGIVYNSVTSIGKNPTFDDVTAICVETHLLDFNRDIYGETITVTFCNYLRGEVKFSSKEALIEQIKDDIKKATN